MALSGKPSSLPSTFGPAGLSLPEHDQKVSVYEQRPHSSYHPVDEQKRRSTDEDAPSHNLEVSTFADGSTIGSWKSNHRHLGPESRGLREIPECMERDTFSDEMGPESRVDKPTKRKRKVLVLLAKTIALLILAIVIAGLFSIPVTLFILESNSTQDSNGQDSSTDAQCSGEVYSGELCRTVLAASQSCIPGRENSSEVLVVLTEQQQALVEQQLDTLLQFVPTSAGYGDELLTFLCLEAFSGFCDTAGAVHRTSRQDCQRITTTTCAAEFQLILPILQTGGVDVSCDAFPEDSSICSSDTLSESGLEMILPSSQPASPTSTGLEVQRNCSDGFFVNEASALRLCTPECGEWSPQSPHKHRVFTIVTLTAGGIGVTLALVVLLLSCVHYKTTFQFPGIFIFYQMLSSLVYIAVFLLNYVDFKSLLCGSRDLVESLMPGNETPFCIISAASWIYISSQVALWWIFHLSMIFCAVFWPFKYHYWRQSGYLKYTHLAMVLTALVLPVIPVIICLRVDGYVLYTLLQPMCVARNSQAAFYSHVLPLITAVAVGLYLLVLIFWKFFSEEWKPSSKHRDSTKRQVEVKILLLLLCYVLVWTDAIGVTVATLIEANDYRNTLVDYFTCEATGTEECPRGTFSQFDVISKLIASFLIALYPGIFIIYFVRLRRCRRPLDASISASSESVLSRKV